MLIPLRLARLTLLVTGLGATLARAEIQTHGTENFPGRHELSSHLGFQGGVASYSVGGNSPSGFKLLLDYGFKFTDLVWLNAGLHLTLGGGCSNGYFPGVGGCGPSANGNTVEPHAGLKLKFKTPIPLVPYAQADAVFVGIYNRYCGDNGVAFGGRLGGGVKYFLLKNLGVGLDFGFTVGPAFYSGAPGSQCVSFNYGSHVELYATYDFSLGAEFIF